MCGYIPAKAVAQESNMGQLWATGFRDMRGVSIAGQCRYFAEHRVLDSSEQLQVLV